MSDKDCWDKAEVVSKFLVPIVVALSVLVWNIQKGNQAASASMVQIAIGILTIPPNEKQINDPLRDWAIETMQNPSNPPALSDEAALQLKQSGKLEILWWNWSLMELSDEERAFMRAIPNESEKLNIFPLTPNVEEQ